MIRTRLVRPYVSGFRNLLGWYSRNLRICSNDVDRRLQSSYFDDVHGNGVYPNEEQWYCYNLSSHGRMENPPVVRVP